MSSTSATDFTGTAIALHWIAAALIVGNLAFGLYMVDLPLTPAKLRYYSWHKWAGVTVFLLSAARLLWRLSHPAPALPSSMPAWQRTAANASHHVLYVLFFAAPLSGWLFSSAAGFQTVYFGVVPFPDLLDEEPGSRRRPQGRPPLRQLHARRPRRTACGRRPQAPRRRSRRRARPHAALPQAGNLTHENRASLSPPSRPSSPCPPSRRRRRRSSPRRARSASPSSR